MKKRLLTTRLAILFSLAAQAQCSWQVLPNAPKSWRLDDFYFLNPQMGWAISPYYYYLFPNVYGQIYKTTDAGNTWVLQKDSAQVFFRSVGFSDSLTGWVGSLGVPSLPGDTIPLYHTADGGTTWLPVTNIPNPRPAGICGISVVTDSVVYAYGRFASPAVLIKTTDKGNSWTSQDMSSYATGLVDGKFFGKDTGFVTGCNGNNALILSTFDGGISWQVRYQSTRNDTDILWKLSFPSRNIGYGSIQFTGYRYPYNAYFVKTTDGGLTWTEMPFIYSYNEQGMGFINDTTGWIGGDDGVAQNFKTTDGGNSWFVDATFGVPVPPYNSYPGFAINRFRRFGDTLMYAAGNTVYKLQCNANTGTKEQEEDNSSLKNFPNPFTDETAIYYSLHQPTTHCALNIFNCIGEEIFAKDLGPQSDGVHRYEFINHLDPGLYYCVVDTDSGKLVRKIVVIK